MYIKWVINECRSRAIKIRNEMESHSGNIFLIGRPRVSGPYSVTELEVMNLVGIYMEVLDREMKPDPDCPECKGTGVVTLLTSSSPCKCLKKHIEVDDDIFNDTNGYWE